MHIRSTRRTFLTLPIAAAAARAAASDWDVTIEQLTHGPKHHFFGYIGHVKNTPWNGDGRYMALLRVGFQDHMPAPAEAADVVLVDTHRNNLIDALDQSRGWNPQQGTMFYWNPKAANTQLIFNDRDPKTNRVFAVLYDIARRKRVREYRFDDTPVGNSGVAQKGGYFLGLNYGRMARLRPVTGYPGAYDWNPREAAPDNDGIFLVEIESGKKRLLVSFRQMADLVATKRPDVKGKQLFINHTLWNRDDNRIYFYVRGDFDAREGRIDVPCIIRPDGSGFKMLGRFIGGHPEWEFGSNAIGAVDKKQILYNVDRDELVGELGTREIIPSPEGDSALSFDGKWFVSGYRVGHQDVYSILRRADGSWVRTRGLPVDNWTGGDLRCDPAPCWNRTGDQIAVPAIAEDTTRTRQTFLLRIVKKG
jgi:hypothetical protein